MTGNLAAIVRDQDVVERKGILVDKHIAEKTVWDKLATINPIDAVISAGNEEDAAKKSEPQITELKAEFNDGIILDLGCGYGRIAKYLLPQRTFAGYVGLDSAYTMLQLFQDRYRRETNEQTTPALFLNANIHTIPLKDDSVDNVVVAAVFLHNHKSVVKQSIDEIQRVLKPGGKLFVYSSFPNKWTLMGLQGALYQMLLNLLGKPYKNGPVRYYGMKEVSNLFEGFGEVNIRTTGFAILPKRLIFLPSILDKGYRTLIANPLNAILMRILPKFIKEKASLHFDVFASK